MRRRFTSVAVCAALATSLTVAPAATAAPPAPPMRTVALAPAPGTAVVLGSSMGEFIPSLVASIVASVALTLLVNAAHLGSSSPNDDGTTNDSSSGSSESGKVTIRTKG